MFRMMVWGALLINLFAGGWTNLFGEEPSTDPAQSATLLEPIDVHSYSFLGIQNELAYSQDQQTLETGDIEMGLGALRYGEITRLIQTERSSRETGLWFNALGDGAGLLGTGWLLWGSNNTANTGWALLLGGVGLRVAGALFFDQAETSLYNAVERSNSLYWEKTGALSSGLKARGLTAIHTSYSAWKGFEYESDGNRLTDHRGFEEKFSATNDFEVQRLFRDSEGQGAAGTWLAVLGGAGGLGTAVGYLSSQTSNEKTAAAWGFVASTVLFGVGEYFLKGGGIGQIQRRPKVQPLCPGGGGGPSPRSGE